MRVAVAVFILYFITWEPIFKESASVDVKPGLFVDCGQISFHNSTLTISAISTSCRNEFALSAKRKCPCC